MEKFFVFIKIAEKKINHLNRDKPMIWLYQTEKERFFTKLYDENGCEKNY